MISAVIIDDEAPARNALSNMLNMFCPNVQVVGQAYDVESGINLIRQQKPEVVFLDIQMPDGTGFDLLKKFPVIDFKFVIVTAHQEFAIKAFKFSAIDYILKPIDPNELIVAVEKLDESLKENETNKRFEVFIDNFQDSKQEPTKVVLKTHETVVVADIEKILRCESHNNYTMFYFTDKSKILVSRTLKDFEDMLSSSGFFRSHQSHLVNLRYVEKYNRYPESHLLLNDECSIPVSVRKREIILELLKKYQKK
jgi:two-component system, LytTR family, response regulator